MRISIYRSIGLVLMVCLSLGWSVSAQAQVIYNGHTYQLTTSATSWTAAEASAVALGGHLVAITDAGEQAFIEANFLTAPAATARPFWIGLTDQAVEGTFVWTTGEPLVFSNWRPGEPNNNQGNENWGAINWHFARGEGAQFLGNWNDVPLNGTVGLGGNTDGPYLGIMEFAAVPEPSSMLLLGSVAIVSGIGAVRYRRKKRLADGVTRIGNFKTG